MEENEGWGKVLGVVDSLKNLGILYSLVCLTINLFNSTISQDAVGFSCGIMITIFVLEIIGIVKAIILKISGNDDDDDQNGFVKFLTILATIISIIIFILMYNHLLFIGEYSIRESIDGKTWFCTCLAYTLVIAQFLNFLPDTIAMFVDDDDLD